MYDRDVVELALWALEEGMTQAEAAAVAGVGRTSVGNWAAGRLPHDRGVPLRLQGRRGRILPTGGTRPAPKEDAAMGARMGPTSRRGAVPLRALSLPR